MALILKAQVRLTEGCKLRYDCPPMSTESYDANRFFVKYRGKTAYFVDCCYELVGPLDYKGRLPGVYAKDDGIKVRFEGEEETHEINTYHMVIVDPWNSTIEPSTGQHRQGNLPHPILFYPDDVVCYTGLAAEQMGREPRLIGGIFLDKKFTKVEGLPQYSVLETEAERQNRDKAGGPLTGRSMFAHGANTEGDMLELIARGNVWALYNSPDQLGFASDKEELEFWCQGGISFMIECDDAYVKGKFDRAYEAFVEGDADLIKVEKGRNPGDHKDRYRLFKLHDCFWKHREQARALTQRLYPHGVQAELAL